MSIVQHGPVAIIGLGSLFPHARNPRDYWSNIIAGRDCVEDVPATHWSVEDFYDPDPSVPDKTYSKRGAFLPDTPFSPVEFGMPPSLLEVTDVMQMLGLVVAKQVLADAGCFERDWYDPARTGVVLGVTGGNGLIQPLTARLQTPVLKQVAQSCGLTALEVDEIAAKFVKAFVPWQENSFPGMLGNVVAGRIANRFDLGGINCVVDAACASSLAAVRMAVHELASGAADLMIAGGCDTGNSILSYLCFSKTPAFSRAGAIRPFDEAGDGTLIGEGIGMLAFKRLADAEREGDRIYAILRGIGASSDGRFKSIYAPRREGQVVALRRAYQDADVAPETVGLLECHGTGTPLGDLTELTALHDVYQGVARPRSVAVGSVKSQIGHTKAAAGAAGLIKLALALHQRVLPPTINVERPRDVFGSPETPFYVNTVARPWITDPARPRRRAAVSAFGFGGTNFHCVLEEYAKGSSQPDRSPQAATQVLHRVSQVHVWSAPSPAELARLLTAMPGDAQLPRPVPPGHARLVLVSTDDAELKRMVADTRARLDATPDVVEFDLPAGGYYRARGDVPGRVAALFAGQGSQYVGMGRETAMAVPSVASWLDAASRDTAGSESLAQVIFPPPAFDDVTREEQEARLRHTEFAQPAIGALSMGQYAYLAELGLPVAGALGHSFGELSALCAAGSLSEDDFRRLVRARGLAMARPPAHLADSGAMAAVHAEGDVVTRLLAAEPDVVVCNENAADQVVVGGGTDAVRRLLEAAVRAGVRARRLPVSAAFHTRYVEHAVEEFRAALSTVTVAAPRFPVYAGAVGGAYGPDTAANGRTLAEQIRQPIAFATRLRQMYADGFRIFVEFGPRSVLTGLVQRTLGHHDDVHLIPTDAGPGGDGDRALKRAAARLVALGVALTSPNRYAAPEHQDPPQQGMSITLNGANYVSEQSRRTYQDALVNGYRRPDAVSEPAGGGSGPAESAAGLLGPPKQADDHWPVAPAAAPTPHFLAVHERYLTGQLLLAQDLCTLLIREADGQVRGDVVRGIELIGRTSVALAQSHTSAMVALRGDVGHELTRFDDGPFAGVAIGDEGRVPTAEVGAPELDEISKPEPVQLVPLNEAVDPHLDNGAGHSDGRALQLSRSWVPVPAATAVEASDVVPTDASPADSGVETEVVSAALLEVVSEKTGYPVDTLDPAMAIEADLGIDSIKRVEIMGAMRERFPRAPEITPERLAELDTLASVIAHLSGPSSSAALTGEEVVTDPKAPCAFGIGRSALTLRTLHAPDHQAGAFAPDPLVAITGDDAPWVHHLAGRLREDGWRVIGEQELDAGSDRLDAVIHVLGRVDDVDTALHQLTSAFLVAQKTRPWLEKTARLGRAAFLTLTRLDGGLGHLAPATFESGVLGGVTGLVKTLALESPDLFCRAVDIAADRDMDDETVARLVTGELWDADRSLTEVAHGPALGRATPRLAVPTEPAAFGSSGPVPGPADLFVVTGGGRGVTAACALGLASCTGARLLLLGRSTLAEEPAWAAGMPGDELRGRVAENLRRAGIRPHPREVERQYRELVAAREIRANLTAARTGGARVEYLTVDVTDAEATARALRPFWEEITGIVHGAGVLVDRLIADSRPEDVEQVLAPKIRGLDAVLGAVDRERLRHLLVFSSVAGLHGNRGQVGYAMANEALAKAARAIARARPDVNVSAVYWGAWDGGMVTPQLARLFAERDVPLIPIETGVDHFVRDARLGPRSDVVSVAGAPVPLSSRPVPEPSGRVVVERDLAPIATHPLTGDHWVGEAPVLPLAVLSGAVLYLLRGLYPGRRPRVLRDVVVHKGVTFDAQAPTYLRFAFSSPRGNMVDVEVTDPDGRSRYRATVDMSGESPPAPEPLPIGTPTIGGVPAENHYRDGVLFHGPLLRGVHSLLREDEDGLLARCQLPSLPVDGYSVEGFDPAKTDVLLQAAALWGGRRTASSCLPTRIAAMELLRYLPDDGTPFLVAVDRQSRSGAGNIHAMTVTAFAMDGTPLMRLRGVELVCSPALNGKFRAAAAR